VPDMLVKDNTQVRLLSMTTIIAINQTLSPFAHNLEAYKFLVAENVQL
jgi:hypothetical protein